MKLASKKVFLIVLLAMSGIIQAAAEPTKLMDLVKTGPSLEDVQKVLADRNELREINKQNQAGVTALMLFAASASKVKDKATKEAIVDELLSKGADERTKDRDNKTLLMYAVESGDPEIIQLVLNKPELKNNIDDQDNTGSTALHYLVFSQIIRDPVLKADLVKQFVAAGADPKIKNRDGKSALMRAVEAADLDTVQLLLNNPEWININDKDNAGNSALTLLAASTKIQDPNTKIKLIETLIRKGADVKTADGNGKTVFLIAVEQKDLDIVPYWLMVQFWLDAAKTNAEVKKMLVMWDSSGKNALHVAVENKQLALIEKLINIDSLTTTGLTWHGTNPDKKTPFMRAVEMGWIDGVQAILKNRDTSHLQAQDSQGKTPLYYAVESKSLPILMAILSKKADTDRTVKIGAGSDKKTPLLKAVELQWLEGVQAIINQHPESLAIADAHGKTALYYAVENKNLPILDQLLSMKTYSAEMIKKGFGSEMTTPLMRAAEIGWTEGVRALVKHGDINAVDAQGRNALFYVVIQNYKHNRFERLDWFWDKLSQYVYPPQQLHPDLIKLLIDANINTTTRDKQGRDAWSYLNANWGFSTQNNLIDKETEHYNVDVNPGPGGAARRKRNYKCKASQPCSLGKNQNGFCCTQIIMEQYY
jgi:ankyrin repeat protein